MSKQRRAALIACVVAASSALASAAPAAPARQAARSESAPRARSGSAPEARQAARPENTSPNARPAPSPKARPASPPAYYAPVFKLIKNGDTKSAIDLCKKFEAAHKNDAQWNELMAQCYVHSRSAKRGIPYAVRAAQLKPNDSHNLATLALLQVNAGLRFQSTGNARKALALNAKNARAYAALAAAGKGSGDAMSRKDIDMAVKLDPGDFDVCMISTRFQQSLLDMTEREDAFESFVRHHPDSAEAYYLRGNTRRKWGELANAIRDYSKALELNPNHMLARVSRGKTYRQQREWKKAIDDLSVYIAYGEKMGGSAGASMYARRGECYYEIGELDKAAKDMDVAVKLLERNAVDKNGKFDFRRIPSKAKTDYEAWWVKKINILIKQGRDDDAAREARTLLTAFPENLSARHARQTILIKLKRYGEALSDLDWLIKTCPKVSEYYRQRANVLYRLGRKKEAERDRLSAANLDEFGTTDKMTIGGAKPKSSTADTPRLPRLEW